MKVSELTGAKLDYWVAKALGLDLDYMVNGVRTCRVPAFINCPAEDAENGDMFAPSTRWDHGGPIIERETIIIGRRGKSFGRVWVSGIGDENGFCIPTDIGPTPLIAAMRAFVASKYGEEVPDETA